MELSPDDDLIQSEQRLTELSQQLQCAKRELARHAAASGAQQTQRRSSYIACVVLILLWNWPLIVNMCVTAYSLMAQRN